MRLTGLHIRQALGTGISGSTSATLIRPMLKPTPYRSAAGGGEPRFCAPTYPDNVGLPPAIASASRNGVGEAHFTPATPGTLHSCSMASKAYAVVTQVEHQRKSITSFCDPLYV